MTITVTDNNHKKQVTMLHIAGQRWDITFEGVITRRDLVKLQRLILVEFVKVERRRSAKRLMQISTQVPSPTSEVTPVSTPIILVTPTQEPLNASRNPENDRKVYNPARK